MSHYEFEDVDDPTTCFFVNLSYELAAFSQKIVSYLSAICFVINIFHFLILSRKNMRSNCINVIMMGIAFADLYNLGYNVKNKLLEIFPGDDCTNFYWYYRVLLEQWTQGINTSLRATSAWLSVIMALVRVLVVKYPIYAHFDGLSKPWFGVKSIFSTMFFSFLLTLSVWGKYRLTDINEPWFPDEECGYPANYSEPRFQYDSKDVFMAEYFLSGETYSILVGIGKIIPTVMLPILAVLLVREVRTAEKLRSRFMASQSSIESFKTNQTTKMILLMTIASMFAEGPLGVISCLYVFTDYNEKATAIFFDLESMFAVVVVLNTISHCFICLILSSQYKNTAKQMFMCRIFETSRISPQVIVASNASGTSIKSRDVNSVMVKVE